MGFWWLFPSEDDIRRLIRGEIKRSDIVIEIERKLNITAPSYSEETARQVYQNLRQDLNSEIDRLRDEINGTIKNRIDNRLKSVEERFSKPASTSSNLQTDELRQIRDALSQIQTEQKNMASRLGQIETNSKSYRGAVVQTTTSSNAYQAKIDALSRNLEVLIQQCSSLSENLASLRADNVSLTQRVSELEKQNAALQQNKKQNESRLDQLEQRLKNLENRGISSPKPVARINLPTIPTKKKLWIASFSLSKPLKPVAFFRGDPDTIKTKLAQSIQKIDELMTDLTQSRLTDEIKKSFLKNLKWCMESLTKLYNKFDFEECDPDEISEEITSKFFKIISENLLDNIMIAIYRGGKGDAEYERFLKKLNRYLSDHGIYTQEISLGEPIGNDVLQNIDPPISKRTSVKSEDGKVDEVELLPYFMIYENDDGNNETVRKRGRVILLKYGV